MSNYYYLDVLLELSKDQDRDITPAFFKNHIIHCITRVFGETAAALPIDVLKFHPDTKEAILRVYKDQYVKLRSSLTLCGDYEGTPCGMATGPCGVEFRNAFSCFHYSTAEPKGSDCFDLFKTMQNCMKQFPTLYSKDLGDEEENMHMLDQPAPDEGKSMKKE
ncbi:hypothetical protein Trydic_g15771 [Trypoxylus dichotomus]